MARRDKRGRIIGYNWWREFIMEQFDAAYFTREQRLEENHQMEEAEFNGVYPKPQLKALLILNKGHGRDPDEPVE